MRGGTPVASLDGHGRESLSFGGSSEEGGGGWFMGRTGPLRRPPFSSVGNDSMLSFKVALEEGAPTSPDWTTAALSPEQPFQFGADFGRYPPPPPTGRLSPSQCYSPQPTSATDNLLPSSPPQTARRRSLSHPPLPAFPCPPPRVQSRRSATAPCVLPSQAGHLNQLTGGYHPFAMEASQGDGHAGARGAPNEFGIEEIGVARG
ncbi:hypothetical protein BCR35DRAFT_303252 [Leucosporidium creatinivorum]|uniref:Uncharacterized protein n=1 Tax=Leucosporidium creatinivorum TaxID=106004 RepID=A0A1Y2FJP1_9BASI|nr:hypothetical protein BCR35DRAFT_303252 [Leucosporidium creatinivorum]